MRGAACGGRRHLGRPTNVIAAALAGTALCTIAAQAQDATWKTNPGSNDYNTAANWTPATVPTGTASFGASSITNLTLSADTTIGSWTFDAGASNYTFNTSNHNLTFTGVGIVINGGSATITNNGLVNINFKNSSTAGSATIINNGFISFFNTSTAGSAAITNNLGMSFLDASTAGNATITNNSRIIFNNNSTAGNAAITNNATGTVDFSNSSGPNGDNKLSAGSIAGFSNIFVGANQLTFGGNNLSTTFSGEISDCGPNNTACFKTGAHGGSLVKIGTGTFILSGLDIADSTTVNAGTLEVDGTIVFQTTVNNGGTLSGTGTVGNLRINNGGMLAPGNASNRIGTLNITGSLVLQSAALYMIAINGANASKAAVTGTATLGDANVQIASGSTVTLGQTYTILTSTTGVLGTFNPVVSSAPILHCTLSYDAHDVLLTCANGSIIALLPPGAPANVINVANAIDSFITGGGPLPAGFSNLFNLTPQQLVNALTALDGENATGAEHSAFQLMNEFLNLMLDLYVDGRIGGGTGGPLPFAPDQQASLPPDIALAYASVLKAPPQQTFAQRWTAWGAGFGGSATTNGDPVVGSNNVRTGTFGYAAGMDYHFSPDTVLGFALAGGGTSWNLAQGLGTGRSDALLAGIYGVTHQGPAYVGAALAFANNWFATSRTALGDQLNASFQGQSYAARLEGGYRFAMPLSHSSTAITPYAAIQAQDFHTPAYNETDLTAGGFGLSYAAMDGTDTRSELGARFDDLTTLRAMPLILRAKAAWAHDWVSNPALNASFQALPGIGFTVNGAPIPHDSALTSAAAQLFFRPNWSFLAKFDGEFAKGSQVYAGTGTLRHTW